MSKDFLSKLNIEQKKAVTHQEGPALVVAGAGTGKTTVIVNRILWLIQNNVINADQILALTFTDKAAQEMEERVDRVLPYGYIDLWVHTFHKFCEKVLRAHGLEIGLRTDFRVISGTEQWILVRNNLDRFDLDYFKPLNNPTKFIQVLLGHFSRCKDENILAEHYLAWIEEARLNNDARQLFEIGGHYEKLSDDEKELLLKGFIHKYDEVATAYHTYQQLLLENNYLDFGDLIQCTLKLFKQRPLVLDYYRQKFQYLLVDEFQDTNTAQYDLVKLLGYPLNNIMVVGDDDQSIYRFRGASIQNIMQFKDDYPEAVEIVLGMNYRSCQEVLDIAYHSIIHNNPYRLEEKLGINKKLKSYSTEPGIVEHIHCQTAQQEIDSVIAMIEKIKNQHEARWSDFAILMRANNQATAFMRVLEQKHIPFQFIASKGLYLKPVVLDIISYFKILYNHYDDSALYRVLNIPSFRIHYTDIVKITQYTHQKGISLFDGLDQIVAIPDISSEGVSLCNLVLSLLRKQTKLLQEKTSLSDIFVLFLHDSGYLDYLTQEENIDNYYALTYLEQFHRKLKSYEDQYPEGSLKDFLDSLILELESGETGSLVDQGDVGDDKVQLLTIHASKGLEFKYVFIVHLVDKRFPTIRRTESLPLPNSLLEQNDQSLDDKDAHLHEERRLFYVAITRAKDRLYFTSAENYGGVRKKKLSIFLQELGFEQKIPTSMQKDLFIKPEQNNHVQKVVNVQLPKKFSFTQLKDFETCPLLYKYKYLLRIPTRGNRHMSFGSSMHKTLERFFREVMESSQKKQVGLFTYDLEGQEGEQRFLPGKKRLLELYEDSWIDHWYENKQQQHDYKDLGKKILSVFYDNYCEQQPHTLQIEQAFNVKLGNYTIAGRIDRIDKKDETRCKIIDYKTGTPKEKLSKDDKRQLSLYQLAAEQILKLNVQELTYYYLQDNSQISFILKDKDKKDFEEWVVTTIDAIRNSDFTATPGRHCAYCAYNSICEFKEV